MPYISAENTLIFITIYSQCNADCHRVFVALQIQSPLSQYAMHCVASTQFILHFEHFEFFECDHEYDLSHFTFTFCKF